MTNEEQLMTTAREGGSADHAGAIIGQFDVWAAAIKRKNTQGRGSNKKIELYGIKKLRELILELAVRGLLVPQDPNDEPANVLLKKITAEKSRLVKEGKIKKQKKLPPISDEEKPFDLPEGWGHIRLGNIVNISTGKLDANAAVENGKYPFFTCSQTPSRIDKFAFDTGAVLLAGNGDFNIKYYSGKFEAYQRTYVIEPIFWGLKFCFLLISGQIGEITKNNRGSAVKYLKLGDLTDPIFSIPPLAEQHRIVAKVDELMALCDQLEQRTETSLSAHQTLVETLLGALTATDSQNTHPARGAAAGGKADKAGATARTANSTTRAADNARFTDAWQRIAAHFDTLFTTEHSIDQLKQTILQLAVQGKLVPQDPNDEPASELLKKIAAEKARLVKAGKIKKQKPLPPISEEEKPFELPEGWEWSRLPEIGELARGKSKHRPRNDQKLYSEGSIPLVQTGDVSRANGTIKTYTALYNEIGLEQSRLWPEGTMCITIAANIADTGILGFDACFPDSVVGFTPMEREINVVYFEYFIRTAKNHLEQYAPSTAQKNINLEILGKLLVPCPPLQEISRIVAKVDELMGLCDQLKARLGDAQSTQLHLADAMAEQAIA